MKKTTASNLIVLTFATFIAALLARGGGLIFIFLLLPPFIFVLLPLFALIVSPLFVPLINKGFPGDRLSRIDTGIQILYAVLWLIFSVGLMASYFRNELSQLFGGYVIVDALLSFQAIVIVLGSTLVLLVALLLRSIVATKKASKLKGWAFMRTFFIRRGVRHVTTVVLVTVGMLAVLFVGLDIYYRVDYDQVASPVSQAVRNVAAPVDGAYRLAVTSKGEGVIARTSCFLLVCPESTEQWVVPIEPGKESDFLYELVAASGAAPAKDQSCLSGSDHLWCFNEGVTKNGVRVRADLQEADSYHHNVPETDISPKVWRSISISAH